MTNNTSKISFVVPAYNSAETISESIDSIFNGNFESGDEVIIVNDASTDRTEEKIIALQKKYPPIIYLKNKENRGCPATRNIGIHSAKNPLIFNLDADDVLAKKSVATLKEYLIAQNADISAFGESRFFTKSIKKITHKWVYKGGVITLADYLAGPYVPGGNLIYTKKSWKKIGGYWEYGKGLHEFWGFGLKQIAMGSKFVVLPDSYYFHRYGKPSLFVRESRDSQEGSRVTTKMIMDFIGLLREDDAKYIRSEEGKNWFDNISEKPIHVLSGELGITGYKVSLDPSGPFVKMLKKILPENLKTHLKRILKKT
ncbi:MAG: glycosyltransferase family 2 protein [Candidatus Pacebacteria bacterium]|nr:glycosyltransferase family 2 protein [Candidatus Paceibacterota bacterium]